MKPNLDTRHPVDPPIDLASVAAGIIKPGFDGTQPKITDTEGTLEVVPMEDLKQRSADADGMTVAEQEDAAIANEQSTNAPDTIDGQRAADVAREEVAAEDAEDDTEVDPKALAELSIAQIGEQIGTLNKRQLNSLEKAEAKGKQRAGVAELIERRRAELG